MTLLASALSVSALLLGSPSLAAAQAILLVEPAVVDFGAVVEGAVVEPQVTVRNTSGQTISLRGAQMRAPLIATRMPATIGPGESATLRFRLDTASLLGSFESDVVVLGPDHAEVAHLIVQGQVHAIVGAEPGVVVLATQPGERKQATTVIVRRGADPVEVSVDRVPDGLVARLTTIEAGARYRLDVESTGSAPAGRHRLAIALKTTSVRRPAIGVPVNLLVRPRVYTFPEQVEFGRLGVSEATTAALTQTLMVYQQGGRAFHARFETDVPGLAISAEPGPTGDRWQATLTLDPKVHGVGEIRGQVVVTTDDPAYPRLSVAVGGALTK